jgi:hypothetical protein
MLVTDIFKDVSSRLQDMRTTKRWAWDSVTATAPSLLTFINIAILEIVNQRPDTTATTEKVKLSAGYMQPIPNTASSLIDILYSYKADGSIGGPVTQAKRSEIQQIVNSLAPTIEIDTYAYDKMDNPKVFFVCPVALLGSDAYVQMTYSAKPTLVTAHTEPFPLPDQYAPAAIHWMLYSIYSGDNEDTDLVRAQSHYEAFYQSLGIKIAIDKMYPMKPKAGGN